MSTTILSLIMDIAVLACLGYTIYIALRLSKGLNNFKNNRKELRTLIETLSQNIQQAENATIRLKEDSYETADELRSLIRDAKAMKQEVFLMNEAGNNLAKRLEILAETAPKNVRLEKNKNMNYQDKAGNEEVWLDDEEEIYLTDAISESFDDDLRGFDSPFAIQDREFEEAPAQSNQFESEAERDLYQALQKKRKAAG